ncbi:hypothetical protein V9T40_009463 [Parthenolecanium corni]|uniref:Uncharacterized protein n=1 Tax=Parthenolecanium corni TaxID=536013 RepID=A0AAN9TQG3_9HEMI
MRRLQEKSDEKPELLNGKMDVIKPTSLLDTMAPSTWRWALSATPNNGINTINPDELLTLFTDHKLWENFVTK